MISVDTRLFRGPRPENYEDLISAGIQSVISLESGWFEALHQRRYAEDIEAQRVFQKGIKITLFHLPISGFGFPPSFKQTKDFLAEADWLRSRGSVYFHCLHGVDRTGWMAAAWRVVKQNWPIDSALAEWRKLGFHEYSYFWWPWAFRRCMKRFK